jgi:cytochrome c-type biogenesis protein CcmH/NrfG
MNRADSPAPASESTPARAVSTRLLLVAALGVFVAATLAYLPKVRNRFTFDDPVFITQNPRLRSLHEVALEFTRNQARLFRPLRSATLAGIIAVCGTERPLPFHLAGICFHASASALVLLIVWLTLADFPAAVAAGLIFALHPVHADRAVNITGSFDLLGLMLGYAAWALLLAYNRGGKPWLGPLGALTLLLGCLASEEAVMVAPLLAVCLFIAAGDRRRRRWALLLAFAMVIAYVAIRTKPVHGVARTFEYAAGGFGPTVWTMAVVFWKYVGLLLFPIGLSPAYGPHIYSTPSLASAAGLAGIVALLALGVVSRRRAPAVSLAVAWFCLGLAPFSNLLPSDTLMVERYLYAGLGGFAVAGGAAWAALARRRRSAIAVGAVVWAIYAVGVASRCAAWWQPLVLWGQAAVRQPNSYLANLNGGYHSLMALRLDDAERFAQRAHALEPNRPEPLLQLGDLAVNRGDPRGGLAFYDRAIAASPEFCSAYTASASAYVLLEEPQRAGEAALAAIQCDPAETHARYVLAYLFVSAGDCAAAAPQLEAILRATPRPAAYAPALDLRKRCDASQ